MTQSYKAFLLTVVFALAGLSATSVLAEPVSATAQTVSQAIPLGDGLEEESG